MPIRFRAPHYQSFCPDRQGWHTIYFPCPESSLVSTISSVGWQFRPLRCSEIKCRGSETPVLSPPGTPLLSAHPSTRASVTCSASEVLPSSTNAPHIPRRFVLLVRPSAGSYRRRRPVCGPRAPLTRTPGELPFSLVRWAARDGIPFLAADLAPVRRLGLHLRQLDIRDTTITLEGAGERRRGLDGAFQYE